MSSFILKQSFILLCMYILNSNIPGAPLPPFLKFSTVKIRSRFRVKIRIHQLNNILFCSRIYNSGVQNESEINWPSIADGWSSVRSPQWLRSKWWTIKKHVPQCLSFPGKHYVRRKSRSLVQFDLTRIFKVVSALPRR